MLKHRYYDNTDHVQVLQFINVKTTDKWHLGCENSLYSVCLIFVPVKSMK